MSDFDFRPIDLSPEGIMQACELLRLVFPTAAHIDPDYLTRLYLGNPLGETFGNSCFDSDGRLVAHNILIPIKARVFGREELGIWPFQLATHPHARMKGLFAAIMEKTHVDCRERGYGFLSGVGNQNSTPILVGKWGYQSICPLDVKLGIGTTPPSRHLDDGDFVRVWDDPRAIAWRIRHATTAAYRVRWRREVGHLYADAKRYGIQVEIGAFPRSRLPESLPPLRSTNPLRLWIGKDPTRDWSRSLYFDVPGRLRPSPLNLLWYDLTGRKRRHDPDKVQYQVFDFDAY